MGAWRSSQKLMGACTHSQILIGAAAPAAPAVTRALCCIMKDSYFDYDFNISFKFFNNVSIASLRFVINSILNFWISIPLD